MKAHHAAGASNRELTERLRRIEGQVRGVQHMIERGDTCVDVLTQLAAARAALAAVGLGVVGRELRHALADGSADPVSTADHTITAVELLLR